MEELKGKINTLISVIELTENKVGLETLKEIQTDIDESISNNAIKFARWLLVNCDMGFDNKMTLSYEKKGLYYTTDEIYKLYLTLTE